MCPVELKPGCEEVFTVTDYYDGPRQGIADFNGRPHFYDCIFDERRHNYSNLFRLTPVEPAVFQLAMESWAIWQRWESAFHAGHADQKSHPALPEDRARHEELKVALDSSLKTDEERCIVREASFDVAESQVKWTDPTKLDQRQDSDQRM